MGKWLFPIIDADNVNHVVVFLTGYGVSKGWRGRRWPLQRSTCSHATVTAITTLLCYLLTCSVAAIPAGMGAAVYFCWPSPEPQWQLLGMLYNEKPSSIWRVRMNGWASCRCASELVCLCDAFIRSKRLDIQGKA